MIELPDRSRQYVPASWCTPLAVPSEEVTLADHPSSEHDLPLLSLAGLRELAALVRHLKEREGAHGDEHTDRSGTDAQRDQPLPASGMDTKHGKQHRDVRVAELGELPLAGSGSLDSSDRPDSTPSGPGRPDAPERGRDEVMEP